MHMRGLPGCKKPSCEGILRLIGKDNVYIRGAHNNAVLSDEVLQDVEFVWSNCRLYNTNEGSEILVLLDRAEKLFQSLWQKAGLAQKTGTSTAEGQAVAEVPQEEAVSTLNC